MAICRIIGSQTISSPRCPIRSLVTPKKTFQTKPLGKFFYSHICGGGHIRHTQKFKIALTWLLEGVQSSITTLKCSEESHYGVRIRVSIPSDLPFSRYGPRPFFGPAILAKNWENVHYIQFAYVRSRFLCLLVPEIDCS